FYLDAFSGTNGRAGNVLANIHGEGDSLRVASASQQALERLRERSQLVLAVQVVVPNLGTQVQRAAVQEREVPVREEHRVERSWAVGQLIILPSALRKRNDARAEDQTPALARRSREERSDGSLHALHVADVASAQVGANRLADPSRENHRELNAI